MASDRACGKCGVELTPVTQAPKRGLRCRACETSRLAQYHAKHRLEHKAAAADYYRANAAEIRAAHKERLLTDPSYRAAQKAHRRRTYAKHRAARIAYSGQWMRANPDKCQVYAHVRRAAIRGTPNRLTTAEWLDVKRSFNGACAYCLRTDRPLTMDHVQALSRGGHHSADNVVPACKSCNCRKRDRGILTMLGA